MRSALLVSLPFLLAAVVFPTSPASAGVQVTVHADPGHFTPENADKLIDLVRTVHPRGHRLTVLLAPDWAAGIEASPFGKGLLRQAVMAGHKVGFHHHDCGHVSPDGYLADHFWPNPGDACRPGFERIGTVEEAFAPILRLQSWLLDSGVPPDPARSLNIAAQGPNSNGEMRLWEWQAANIYATGPIESNSDGHDHVFITRATCHTYSNDGLDRVRWNVPEIGHRQIDVGDFRDNGNTLARFQEELFEVFDPSGSHYGSGVHLGVVFHAREFDEHALRQPAGNDRAYILAFFDAIEAYGERAVPADELLRQDQPCEAGF